MEIVKKNHSLILYLELNCNRASRTVFFFPGSFVFGSNVDNSVGVYVEGHFNMRITISGWGQVYLKWEYQFGFNCCFLNDKRQPFAPWISAYGDPNILIM